jgi:hypothetical protein
MLVSIAALPILVPSRPALEHSRHDTDEKMRTRDHNHYHDGDEYDPSNYPDNSICAVCASFFS